MGQNYEYRIDQLPVWDLPPEARAMFLTERASEGWQIVSTTYIPRGQGVIEYLLERRLKS